MGTVTQATSAWAFLVVSSPGVAGYGSTALTDLVRRVTSGILVSTTIRWNRESALRSITSSVRSNDWLPYV